MASFTYKPGNVIHLKYSRLTAPSLDYYIPVSDDFSFESSQSVRQPIKEMWEYFNETVLNAAGIAGSTAALVVQAAQKLANLTGLQFAKKDFYQNAWKGSEPPKFSIKLKFNTGMANKWSAYDEVYTPILALNNATLPDEGNTEGLFLNAPMPIPGDAFLQYGNSLIAGAKATFSSFFSAKAIVSTTVEALTSTQTLGAVTDQSTSISSVKNSSGLGVAGANLLSTGLWTVEFGFYASDKSTPFIPYITLYSMIAESASFSFSKEVMYYPNLGKVYPLSGDITLSMICQSIPTSSTFSSL